jgi:hypothetical protein
MEIIFNPEDLLNVGTTPFPKWEEDLQAFIGALNRWQSSHDTDDVQMMLGAIISINQDIQEIQSSYPALYETASCQQIIHFFNDPLFRLAPSLTELAEEGAVGSADTLLGMMDQQGELFSKNGLSGQLQTFYNILETQ